MLKLSKKIELPELKRRLKIAGAPFKNWGSSGGLTLNDFWNEIRNNMAHVMIDEDETGRKRVDRQIRAVVIDVFARSHRQVYKLKQVEPDGKAATAYRTNHSLYHRIGMKEDANEAVRTCVEKLGLERPIHFVDPRIGESSMSSTDRYKREHPESESSMLVTKISTYELPDAESMSFEGVNASRELRHYLCVIPEYAELPRITSLAKNGSPIECMWGNPNHDEMHEIYIVRKG